MTIEVKGDKTKVHPGTAPFITRGRSVFRGNIRGEVLPVQGGSEDVFIPEKPYDPVTSSADEYIRRFKRRIALQRPARDNF